MIQQFTFIIEYTRSLFQASAASTLLVFERTGCGQQHGTVHATETLCIVVFDISLFHDKI